MERGYHLVQNTNIAFMYKKKNHCKSQVVSSVVCRVRILFAFLILGPDCFDFYSVVKLHIINLLILINYIDFEYSSWLLKYIFLEYQETKRYLS